MASIILIDGSSYLYRAYHALPPLTNKIGEPTGALHGVLTMIQKLLREEQPDNVAIIFDAPGKTFRNELYTEYKSNRPPMPDELSSQIQPIKDAIKAMGLPLLQIKGVEADDVIGTLCKQAYLANHNVLVSTGDKDLAQLVNEKVSLVNTMNNSVMDREGVKKKFDVFPDQIIDYLALVGDTSDNIPGVPKVGAKTAAKLLNLYGNVDGILKNIDEIKGKVGDNLKGNIDQLKLSQNLATIRLDLDLSISIKDLVPVEIDKERLCEIYNHFELRSLLEYLDDEIEKKSPAKKTTSIKKYETILTWKAFEHWMEKINQSKLTAFDTETTDIYYMDAKIVGLSLSVKSNEAAYIPLAHNYPGAPEQLPLDEVLGKIRNWLEDEKKKKVGHHLKYDAHILERYGIKLAGMQFDSMLESYVLNSIATRHNMNSVAKHYLDYETIRYEDVAGKGVKQLKFNQIDLEIAAPYAAEDADITLQLHNFLWNQLSKNVQLKNVYENIEQPLIQALLEMEENGVLIDRKMLTSQSNELAKKIIELEKKAHELAGQPFNLSSPKQLQTILFDQQGLPIIRKTPKGQPSTAEDVLIELANDYELPAVIIEFRSISKLKSTYTDKLPLQISNTTGRIHTSYHQTVTATGRLSSTDPNLQNIPIKTPEGRRIRKAFIAPKGQVLLAADYSQIELRIMAHLSSDPTLIKAFTEEKDIHRSTAAEVFNITIDDVTNEQRRSAKAINFGLMYGMSPFGLSKQLGISRGEAKEYVDMYFARYPGVKSYMDDIRETARENGFVETVFGRRLYLPEINARNVNRRQYAERTAINAPMQGTAADIIKNAMISIHKWLQNDDSGANMIMQVHDELVFEIDKNKIESAKNKIENLMNEAAKLSVPLKVDVGVGKNWDEAH
ncbi:MAG: DNA polymerase I [Woeseia sp.]|nr:DNA polymerase I [Woeseia sp.]